MLEMKYLSCGESVCVYICILVLKQTKSPESTIGSTFSRKGNLIHLYSLQNSAHVFIVGPSKYILINRKILLWRNYTDPE